MTELSVCALDPTLGVHLLRDFLNSTKTKNSFLYLFLHQPKVARDLARLFGSSPYFGGLIAARPELIDSFLFKTRPAPPVEWSEFLEYLIENRLINEVLAITELLENHDISSFTLQLSNSADEICRLLLSRIQTEFKEANLSILCLGKWGSRELGLRSDLDFIFITDATPNESDFKVAKRFLSRLTETHRGGAIYPVDLRLRPSGQAGPIITDRPALLKHLKEKSEAWERQSYLRARGLIENDAASNLREALHFKLLTKSDYLSLKDIRQKLLKEVKALDLKYSYGGLIEIAFCVQIWGLRLRLKDFSNNTCDMISQMQNQKQKTNENRSAPWARLAEIYKTIRLFEQLHYFVSEQSSTQMRPQSEPFSRLSRLLRQTPTDLSQQIETLLNESCALLKELDPLSDYK